MIDGRAISVASVGLDDCTLATEVEASCENKCDYDEPHTT